MVDAGGITYIHMGVTWQSYGWKSYGGSMRQILETVVMTVTGKEDDENMSKYILIKQLKYMLRKKATHYE